ncbi:hypothetical protein B0H15DRAFT_5836 [Mycena belliarum]|uniref:BTB domain-containing protein n=1 Tax=Mycena belliarum TaxID=1033014 RepID=A0AAD6UID8_9AGAR|nr:hypothetical protein B0H15DRAFT_5836 [Mycena belliae]
MDSAGVVVSERAESARHSVFWFDDGSLVLQVESVMFKVHRALLARQSPFLLSISGQQPVGDSPNGSTNEPGYLEIDNARKVSALDFEVLLEHVYHDIPMSPETRFPRVASIVRVSSPGQLHFPRIHETALRYFAALFPSGPAPFFHPQYLEEALDLATAFNVASIQKGLLYSLVTSTNFDTQEVSVCQDAAVGDPGLPASPAESILRGRTLVQGNTDLWSDSEATAQLAMSDSPAAAHKYELSPRDSQRCMSLMTHLIDHFSPILFTPPATPHMACTDVFADTWMNLVIQPAIDDEGVYKPLETLERIKGVDWGDCGLCSACVSEKNAEWTEEQETLWRLMDQWLGL